MNLFVGVIGAVALFAGSIFAGGKIFRGITAMKAGEKSGNGRRDVILWSALLLLLIVLCFVIPALSYYKWLFLIAIVCGTFMKWKR